MPRKKYCERSSETVEFLGGAPKSKTRPPGDTVFIASRKAEELRGPTIASSGATPSSAGRAAFFVFLSRASPGLNILAPSFEAKERRYSLRSPTATLVYP